MEQILNTQLFGLVTIILFYNIGLFIQKKARNPICNGLLISIILIIVFLKVTNIPYESFKIGADTINFMLGPVTVVLAVPLYRQFHLFKKYMKEILVGILTGVFISFVCVVLICKVANADSQILYSILPKSITVVCIILTGILGYIMGEAILKISRIKHPISKGIALGTAAHAVGTSKALELGEIEGAMGSLSIGIAGCLTVILIPILSNFI